MKTMDIRNFTRNPFFIVGLLMMFIFLWDLNRENGFFSERAEKLRAHSCHAALVKLERRIPATWKASCDGNNMAVHIKNNFDENELKEKSTLKQYLYREMANNLMFISKTAPDDNLERTNFVRLKLEHKKMTINALTEGKYLAKLKSLTEPKMMAEHLKATVQVQEVPADKAAEKSQGTEDEN